MKKLQILLAVLCLFCSHLNGNEEFLNKYIRCLEWVEVEQEAVKIHLSGNLVFNWIPQSFEKEMLTPWKQGDKIEIFTSFYSKGLVLLNPITKVFYGAQVTLTENSVENLPVIEKKSFHVGESDRFGVKTDVLIYLSDGSTWLYTDLWDFEKEIFEKWNIGDKILITQETLLDEEFVEDEENNPVGMLLINYSLVTTENEDVLNKDTMGMEYYDSESDELNYIAEDQEDDLEEIE